MNSSTTKIGIAIALFTTWVGLVFAKARIPELETAPLITAIQTMLAGLGVYHTTLTAPAAPNNETTNKETK